MLEYICYAGPYITPEAITGSHGAEIRLLVLKGGGFPDRTERCPPSTQILGTNGSHSHASTLAQGHVVLPQLLRRREGGNSYTVQMAHRRANSLRQGQISTIHCWHVQIPDLKEGTSEVRRTAGGLLCWQAHFHSTPNETYLQLIQKGTIKPLLY